MPFLTISRYNQPLWRLDRFVDPKTEQQFGERACSWGLDALRLQCVVAAVLSVYNIVVFVDMVEWWVSAIMLAVSVAAVLASCFAGPARRHPFVLQSLLACFFVGLQSYIGWKQAQMTSMLDLARFGLIQCQLVEPCLDQLKVLSDSAMDTHGLIAFVGILISSWNQWVTLGLAGMNCWIVAAYAAIFAALLSLSFTCFRLQLQSQVAVVFITVTCSIFGLWIGIVLDRARRLSFLAEKHLMQELQASQMADSILNHTLKNILADVAANLEIFLAQRSEIALLEDAIQSLRRGISSCKERQVYLQLVAGEYVPHPSSVNLREFGRQLVAGRNATSSFWDVTAIFDITLFNLVMENAISNAFKHGNPKEPAVHFAIEDVSTPVQALEGPGLYQVRFSISNAAHPDRPPLTPATVQQLFKGEARLLASHGLPTLSDRIGLTHCMLAAELGGITLDLVQTDDTVTFSATASLHVLADAPEPEHATAGEGQLGHFPPGLTFFCLEDSAPSRRLLEFHLTRLCQPRAVVCLGATEEDVELFIVQAQAADVVIVDQHLQYATTHFGTAVIQRLLGAGFAGLVCIRSADAAPDDCAAYARCGAHCVLGKDLLGTAMVEELKAAYVRRQSGARGHRPSFPSCGQRILPVSAQDVTSCFISAACLGGDRRTAPQTGTSSVFHSVGAP